MHFNNRSQAGELLAEKFLAKLIDKENTIVLALPRGGVPVAFEIAKKLLLPMDILLVKKLGAPSYPELAIGSVSEENEEVYNYDLLGELGYKHSDIDPIKERALIKLQEIGNVLRQGRPPKNLTGKDIIVVDDGIETGSTMLAVINILKKRKVRKIIIAVPVAAAEVLINLQKEVDQIVVLISPDPLYSIGEWYEDFIQVETEEAIELMNQNSSIKNIKSSNIKDEKNNLHNI